MANYMNQCRKCGRYFGINTEHGLCYNCLEKELSKYKRAYAEICHQFNFGDEDDYKRMYDACLALAEQEVKI